MARKKVRGESSVGLIVTLIFFILTSCGLGYATYVGFNQQDQLTKDKKASDALYEDMKKQRDWYEFQALLYRAWMGQTTGFDQPLDPKDTSPNALTADAQLKQWRTAFEDGSLGKDGKQQDLPDKAVVADMVKKVEGTEYLVMLGKDKAGAPIPLVDSAGKPVVPQAPPVTVSLGWDKTKARPKVTYEDIYWGLRSLVADRTREATAMTALKESKEAEAKASADAKDLAQKDYEAKVAEINLKDQKNVDQKYDALKADITQKLADADKLATQRLNEKDDADKKAKAEIALLNQTIKEQKGRIDDLNERVAAAQQKTVETPSEGKPIPTDWKIVRMDRSGKQPFINLGTAANIRPGLTFSIHGQGPDGRPLPASKGTLEVLNVVSDTLSQAQVVSVKDSFKDPILPGDYLYNPIFRPGGEQHVVIAGRIDMHGTKGEDLEEFQRLLKRQNVVVDGFVDMLGDGGIKGRLTVGTDFLVLGDIADLKDGTPQLDSVKKLQEQARNNGVRIVPAREFLESMGYRTP